jgi:hypothetical protein
VTARNLFGRKNSLLSLFFPFLLVLLLSSPGSAQGFGLKFAYPTTDALVTTVTNPFVTYSAHGQAPKFGVTGELRLPAGLLFEMDALYSRLSYAVTDTTTLARQNTVVNCWDFPVLVKKKFFNSAVSPFVNGGAAFRAVNANRSDSNLQPPELVHQASVGFTFGGGLDFKVGKIHVLPEFRYTRLETENFHTPLGLHSNLVQPMFLLGFERIKDR